ncbi:MAG: hypothetical protein ACI9VM_000983 [Candidatus Azotimanducaceae bacterium]|jgi:hypothetical protein
MDAVTQRSSQVGSSVSQKTQVFDVSDENQLLKLLNYIRRGPFDQVQKGKLRDIVLDYATSKDTQVLSVVATALLANRVSLTQNGEPLSITASAAQGSNQSPVSRDHSGGFAGGRPTPSFGGSIQTVQPQPQVQKQVSPVVDLPPAEEKQLESTPKQVLVEEKKIQVTEVQAPAPHEKPQAPAPETPAVAKAVPVVPPVPEVTPAAPAPEVAVPPQEEIQVPAAAQQSPIERIKEIKRLVNEKVGNPVNLVDANNAVGCEYMNALLNAMRVLNGGNINETKSTMDRLETAYQSVVHSLESGETVIGQRAPTQAANLGPVSTEESVEVKDVAPASAVEPPIKTSVPIESEPPVAPAQAQADVAQLTPISPLEPQTIPEPLQTVPAEKLQNIPNIPGLQESPAPLAPQSPAPEMELQNPAVPIPIPIPEPAVGSPSKVTQSLADMLKEKNQTRENLLHANAEEHTEAEPQFSSDPFQAPEVSAGLQQLLSEWKLFKSSGVFGIGPSGAEHPLYTVIAPLSMAAVISGRFEGSNQDIKQNITDYMNGWRYEFDVVHEMNETFEHYLRRVIKKILDRQKTAPAA